ncbi:Keratin, type I cytoskeletal 18 [Plecturocebus cupreus]
MASVYAGARGSGSRISKSCSTSFWGSMGAGGLAAGMARVLAGMGGIQNEKETMQSLNNHLASYLDRVRGLETKNQQLESKIQEHLEKKGSQIDNACLAADDFRLRYETELAMRQSVESDIHGLCKVINDISVTWLQLETEIEALKEELLLMKKNHEEEVKGLQAQIASSGLTMEVDAPKSQDLNKIMANIWAQYDELAWKDREELDKYWSQQIEESTTVVTMQSTQVGAAEITLTELRPTVQSLEIDRDSMRNMKTSLENSLSEMEQLNGILLHLESELAQTWAEGQHQGQEYEALLNIKVKLEAEIATYCCLLEDGKDFNLGEALDSSNSMQTIQKTTTRQIVDGKVVSETNDTKVLRH